jgi:hypothetical protein
VTHRSSLNSLHCLLEFQSDLLGDYLMMTLF